MPPGRQARSPPLKDPSDLSKQLKRMGGAGPALFGERLDHGQEIEQSRLDGIQSIFDRFFGPQRRCDRDGQGTPPRCWRPIGANNAIGRVQTVARRDVAGTILRRLRSYAGVAYFAVPVKSINTQRLSPTTQAS